MEIWTIYFIFISFLLFPPPPFLSLYILPAWRRWEIWNRSFVIRMRRIVPHISGKCGNLNFFPSSLSIHFLSSPPPLFPFLLYILPAGEHGEGAKFGIAVLLRHGCAVTCHTHQRQMWKFELKVDPNNKNSAVAGQGKPSSPSSFLTFYFAWFFYPLPSIPFKLPIFVFSFFI